MKVLPRDRRPSGSQTWTAGGPAEIMGTAGGGSVNGFLASLRELIATVVREEMAKAHAQATEPDEYLSTNEAGAVAKVAPGTIRRWIREGRLVGHRAGRVVRVRRADLEQLLRAGGLSHAELSPEELARRDFG